VNRLIASVFSTLTQLWHQGMREPGGDDEYAVHVSAALAGFAVVSAAVAVTPPFRQVRYVPHRTDGLSPQARGAL
jgi:hypothetical protein